MTIYHLNPINNIGLHIFRRPKGRKITHWLPFGKCTCPMGARDSSQSPALAASKAFAAAQDPQISQQNSHHLHRWPSRLPMQQSLQTPG